MSERIAIKLYRHRYSKDVFLARNWNIVGGSESTNFYFATKNIILAIENANRADFESWMHRFPGAVAKMTDSKEVEFDGYKGVLVKEMEFRVKDFELVELTEVSGDG